MKRLVFGPPLSGPDRGIGGVQRRRNDPSRAGCQRRREFSVARRTGPRRQDLRNFVAAVARDGRRRGQVVYALRHGRPGGIFRDRGDLRPERRPRPQCAAGFCQRGPDRAVRHVAERAEGRLRRAPDYYFYAGFGTMPPSMPDCMCCPTTNRVISIIRVRERSTRISSRRMSKSRRRPTGPRMPPKPKRTRCAAK